MSSNGRIGNSNRKTQTGTESFDKTSTSKLEITRLLDGVGVEADVLDVISMVCQGSRMEKSQYSRLPYCFYNWLGRDESMLEEMQAAASDFKEIDPEPIKPLETTRAIKFLFLVGENSRKAGALTKTSDGTSEKDEEAGWSEWKEISLQKIFNVVNSPHTCVATEPKLISLATVSNTCFVFLCTAIRMAHKTIKARTAFSARASYGTSLGLSRQKFSIELYRELMAVSNKTRFFKCLLTSPRWRVDCTVYLETLNVQLVRVHNRELNALVCFLLVGLQEYQHNALFAAFQAAKTLELSLSEYILKLELQESKDCIMRLEDISKEGDFPKWYFYCHTMSDRFIKEFSIDNFPCIFWISLAISNTFSRNEQKIPDLGLSKECMILLDGTLDRLLKEHTEAQLRRGTLSINGYEDTLHE